MTSAADLIASAPKKYVALHVGELSDRGVEARRSLGRSFVTVRGEPLESTHAVLEAIQREGSVLSWT